VRQLPHASFSTMEANPCGLNWLKERCAKRLQARQNSVPEAPRSFHLGLVAGAAVNFWTHAVFLSLALASQPAMHDFAEERRKVRGIVEANQRQVFWIGAFQQVQADRSLTESPHSRQAQAENPAEQHAVHGVV
jgi:hypothetical protein